MKRIFPKKWYKYILPTLLTCVLIFQIIVISIRILTAKHLDQMYQNIISLTTAIIIIVEIGIKYFAPIKRKITKHRIMNTVLSSDFSAILTFEDELPSDYIFSIQFQSNDSFKVKNQGLFTGEERTRIVYFNNTDTGHEELIKLELDNERKMHIDFLNNYTGKPREIIKHLENNELLLCLIMDSLKIDLKFDSEYILNLNFREKEYNPYYKYYIDEDLIPREKVKRVTVLLENQIRMDMGYVKIKDKTMVSLRDKISSSLLDL